MASARRPPDAPPALRNSPLLNLLPSLPRDHSASELAAGTLHGDWAADLPDTLRDQLRIGRGRAADLITIIGAEQTYRPRHSNLEPPAAIQLPIDASLWASRRPDNVVAALLRRATGSRRQWGYGASHMDVFEVRRRLIADYQEYTRSFVDIADPDIAAYVSKRIEDGYQWPEPWLSLNPNFASGGLVTDLVSQELLEPRCAEIFRREDGSPLRLHEHQREAIKVAGEGHSYVLTTGTGSGKSLAYLIPVVDYVLRERAAGTYAPGVKAIVVYPMNALANSQWNELHKFLGSAADVVTFDRYTGQEKEGERRRILANPPDILLTNYVMAELVLTRPREREELIAAARGLRFLVLDELHTYRGRQGADVALLVRRLREACDAPEAQCVGTSATMTTEGGPDRQREVVADVAGRMFGVPVAPEHVIGETVARVTNPSAAADSSTLAACVARRPPPGDFESFVRYPLASWVEQTLGFEPGDEAAPARRRRPLTRIEAADELAAETGRPAGECADAIMATLQAGSRLTNPATGRPVFAFRVHQFLSKGDNVYVTLEPPATRYITSKYQYQAPGEQGRPLFPLAFCRECGTEYLAVFRRDDAQGKRYEARRDNDASGGDGNTGYLFISDTEPWPTTRAQVLEDRTILAPRFQQVCMVLQLASMIQGSARLGYRVLCNRFVVWCPVFCLPGRCGAARSAWAGRRLRLRRDGPPFFPLGWSVLVKRVPEGLTGAASRSRMPPSTARSR